jgi:hypothetical protein
MGTIRFVNRLALILGMLAVALLPVALLRAANPDTQGHASPCLWTARAAATGNGLRANAFADTYGSCVHYQVDVYFRGSDYGWYHYVEGPGNFPVIQHFCSNPDTGGGPCWWSDIVDGWHWVQASAMAFDSDNTWAVCVGC